MERYSCVPLELGRSVVLAVFMTTASVGVHVEHGQHYSPPMNLFEVVLHFGNRSHHLTGDVSRLAPLLDG